MNTKIDSLTRLTAAAEAAHRDGYQVAVMAQRSDTAQFSFTFEGINGKSSLLLKQLFTEMCSRYVEDFKKYDRNISVLKNDRHLSSSHEDKTMTRAQLFLEMIELLDFGISLVDRKTSANVYAVKSLTSMFAKEDSNPTETGIRKAQVSQSQPAPSGNKTPKWISGATLSRDTQVGQSSAVLSVTKSPKCATEATPKRNTQVGHSNSTQSGAKIPRWITAAMCSMKTQVGQLSSVSSVTKSPKHSTEATPNRNVQIDRSSSVSSVANSPKCATDSTPNRNAQVEQLSSNLTVPESPKCVTEAWGNSANGKQGEKEHGHSTRKLDIPPPDGKNDEAATSNVITDSAELAEFGNPSSDDDLMEESEPIPEDPFTPTADESIDTSPPVKFKPIKRLAHLPIYGFKGKKKKVPLRHACPNSNCTMIFESQTILQNHINAVHKKMRIRPCPQCDSRSFYYESTLRRHIKTVHENIRPFQCELCPQTFTQSNHRKHHVSSVHDKNRPHLCAECGKSFSSKYHFNNHMRKHAENSIKCTLCSFSAISDRVMTKHLFDQHRAEDTTSLLQKCTLCSYITSGERDLTLHHDKVHMKHTCGLCKNRYGTRKELSQHLLEVHARPVTEADVPV